MTHVLTWVTLLTWSRSIQVETLNIASRSRTSADFDYSNLLYTTDLVVKLSKLVFVQRSPPITHGIGHFVQHPPPITYSIGHFVLHSIVCLHLHHLKLQSYKWKLHSWQVVQLTGRANSPFRMMPPVLLSHHAYHELITWAQWASYAETLYCHTLQPWWISGHIQSVKNYNHNDDVRSSPRPPWSPGLLLPTRSVITYQHKYSLLHNSKLMHSLFFLLFILLQVAGR